MTKIFLLGTFHFNQVETNFFTEDMQNQLWNINERIAKFNPDAIAVEAAVHAQCDIDASYEKFSLDDFSNYDKMRNESLGTITMFGGQYPIKYDNEAIQIGYRLGKSIGLEKIHAIDDDTLLSPINEAIPKHISTAVNTHLEAMSYADLGSLLDKLLFYNSHEWSYDNQSLYLAQNAIGAGKSYAGANHVGAWYLRNLKIFANLQKLAQNHKRIFALYGCGHLCILRDLINASSDMELVNYRKYLM